MTAIVHTPQLAQHTAEYPSTSTMCVRQLMLVTLLILVVPNLWKRVLCECVVTMVKVFDAHDYRQYMMYFRIGRIVLSCYFLFTSTGYHLSGRSMLSFLSIVMK